jgi:hypothetical protein
LTTKETEVFPKDCSLFQIKNLIETIPGMGGEEDKRECLRGEFNYDIL